MRLLQVCNVGRVVGGTAACAWTATRALPAFDHHVAFLSPPDAETVAAFAPVSVSSHESITNRDLAKLRPDAILLHNTPRFRWSATANVPTVQYLHSEISSPAAANVALCCSQWLARRLGIAAECVLWQAVTKFGDGGSRRCDLRVLGEMTIGRICTPTARKWPRTIVPFCAELASRFRRVRWEFVGCPAAIQAALRNACHQQATFHPVGWSQRSRLASWDVLLYSNPLLPESFGRVAAEAMRAGCVPVVDRLGGFIEQIPPDCGFLCDGVAEFAAAIERLADPEFRQRMSQRAERRADENFSLKRFAGDLLRWLDIALLISERGA